MEGRERRQRRLEGGERKREGRIGGGGLVEGRGGLLGGGGGLVEGGG